MYTRFVLVKIVYHYSQEKWKLHRNGDISTENYFSSRAMCDRQHYNSHFLKHKIFYFYIEFRTFVRNCCEAGYTLSEMNLLGIRTIFGTIIFQLTLFTIALSAEKLGKDRNADFLRHPRHLQTVSVHVFYYLYVVMFSNIIPRVKGHWEQWMSSRNKCQFKLFQKEHHHSRMR